MSGKLISVTQERILLDLLCKYALTRRKFVLADGRRVDFFVDCKKVLMTGPGSILAGDIILSLMTVKSPVWPSAVGGMTLGSTMLSSAIVQCSYHRVPRQTHPISVADFVSFQVVKDREEISSPISLCGKKVVLVQDVVSNSQALDKCLTICEKSNVEVVGVFSILDLHGAGHNITDKWGVVYRSIYTELDFANAKES